jgi:DNA-binding XRE family transcriptional regulator
MRKSKKERLQKLGYIVTDAQNYLALSNEEMALIDLKVQLIHKLKAIRKKAGTTQKELAKLMHTSQSRIAMLEGGASDVSLDLVCKALFALGTSKKQIAKAIAN